MQNCFLKRKTKNNSWIKSLLKIGLKLEIVIIEDDLEKENLDEVEIYYIYAFRFLGADINNMTPGGTGGDAGGYEWRRRRVFGLSPDGEEKVYEGVNLTSKDGFVPSKVSAVCRGKRLTHKGWKFRYEDDEFHNKSHKLHIAVVVEDIETKTKTIYKSIASAAKAMGASSSNLSYNLKNNSSKLYRKKFMISKLSLED